MAKHRNSERTPLPEATSSLIAKGCSLEGDLASDGTVRVEGAVMGTITAGKAVVVAAGGEVDGSIKAADVLVFGVVKGTITASSRLEIESEAKVWATVSAKRMRVDHGALISGEVDVGEVGPSVSADDRSAEPAESEQVGVAVA